MSDSRDENLLFGVLALQLDFISQEQLITAANAWMVAKSSALSAILVKVGALSQEDCDFITKIVQKHIARSGSPKSSLEMLKQHEPSASESQVHTILTGGNLNDGTRDEQQDSSMLQHGTTIWTPNENSWQARFIRLRELASGGLGIVSVARDQELDREVALKEILERKRMSADAFERFVAEAKITGNLEHPGIVPIYGLGTTPNGSPYYAMRLIRGRSLQEEIAELHGSVGPVKTSRGFHELDSEHLRKLLHSLTFACNAVAYAHSRGVLHRDLKPGNIMLGKFGETIVVDWGLAKVLGNSEQSQMRSEPPLRDSRDSHDSATVIGAALGTPGYMSPEQAYGRHDVVDRRSDVFGLGACLYALLTNVAPFKGSTREETLANARDCRVRSLREVDSSIPVGLAAICMKAMAANPNDRYDRATDLADDLDRWIAGEPITAMPDPLVQRVFRWARRHQSLVTGAAVLLISALLALSVGSYLVREQRNIARSERDRANESALEAERLRDIADKALVKETESKAALLQVLEKFVDGLADKGWAAVPQMESQRIAMVELAVERFQKLYADNPDDVRMKVRLIRILVRGANLYRLVGRLDQASSQFGEAMKLLATLTTADFKGVGLGLLGDSLFAHAITVEAKDGSLAAMQSCEQGVEVCRKRVLLEPESPLPKLALAMALMQRADFALELGAFNESFENSTEGHSVLHKLLQTPLAQHLYYDLFNIVGFEQQAKALLKQGLDEDADKMYAQAEKTCALAIARHPNDNNIEYYATQIERGVAKLAFFRRQLSQGKERMLGAIERMKVLAKNHAATVIYQQELKTMYAEFGAELLLNDEIAKAKELSELAMGGVGIVKMSADAPVGELKPHAISLALSLALAKREGEATDELQKELKLVCDRLKIALPRCEAMQWVQKLSPETSGN